MLGFFFWKKNKCLLKWYFTSIKIKLCKVFTFEFSENIILEE